jgi:trans-aconitate methyltransferase
MNIYKISMSVGEDEAFTLLTTLTEKQIRPVIQPLVDREREEDDFIYSEEYLEALRDAYPRETTTMYPFIETLNF